MYIYLNIDQLNMDFELIINLWAVRDSNPRHQQRQCCALPTELTAPILLFHTPYLCTPCL